MKRVGAGIVLLLVVVASFFLLAGSRRGAGPGDPPAKPAAASAPGTSAIPVLVARVERHDLRRTLEVTGSLKTDEDVEIGSRIEGKVVFVAVKEGDRVGQGQVLVRLDDREIRTQLEQSRASLAEARAKLSLAKNQASYKDTSADSDFRRAQADVDAAKSRVQQAETNLNLVDVQTRTAANTAQANLTAAQQRLLMTRKLTRDQELKQAQLAVLQAKAQLGQAQVDMETARQFFERRQRLFEQDAIAKETVDEAERQFKGTEASCKVAEATVDVAQQRLSLAQEGSRPEEVRMAEEQVHSSEQMLEQARSDQRRRQVAEDELNAAKAAERQSEAALAAAKAGLVQPKLSIDAINDAAAAVSQARANIAYYETRLADMTIRAPVSGVVSTVQAHPGEMLTTSSKLLDLVALNAVFFEAAVPELEIGLLRPGAPAEVTVDSLPGRKLSGSVREIIPVADMNSKAYRVRISVPDHGSRLPANGFARATLSVGVRPDVVTVSRDAILTEGGDKYVWLVNKDASGGTVVARQGVTTGITDGGYIEVLTGLKPGQEVVASGSPVIVDGSAVRVEGRWHTLKTPNAPAGSVPFGTEITDQKPPSGAVSSTTGGSSK